MHKLEKLVESLTNLATLKEMHFNGCKNLVKLPLEFGILCAYIRKHRLGQLCEIGEGTTFVCQVGNFKEALVKGVMRI
jgi:hypothetical protein